MKTQLSLSSIFLQSEEITCLLHDYLDSNFMNILITISRYDIHIEYQGLKAYMRRSNHKSTISYTNIIEINIKLKFSKDRIKLLFKLFVYYLYSFIDLILKKSNDIQIDW